MVAIVAYLTAKLNKLSPVRKKLLFGSAWVLVGRVITALAALIVNAMVARLLPPDAVGSYFLISSIVLILATLGQAGLTHSTTRLIAESMGANCPHRAISAISTSFRLGTLIAFFLGIVLVLGGGRWIFNLLNVPSSKGIVLATAIWISAVVFYGLFAETFRGLHNIRLANIFGGMLSNMLLAILLFGVWIMNIEADLTFVVTLSALGGVVSLPFAVWCLTKQLRFLKKQPQADNESKLKMREVLNTAGPLLIANLCSIIVLQSDIWLIGAFRATQEVAIYGSAARLVLLVSMPLLIVAGVLPPMIAEMYSTGQKKKLERILRVTSTLAGLPALLVLLVLLFFGETVLEIVYGPYYANAVLILRILCFGQIVNVWSGASGHILRMTGHENAYMIFTVAISLLTFFGSLLAVNIFGAVGVAVVVASTTAARNIMMTIVVKHFTGMWTHMAGLSGISAIRDIQKSGKSHFHSQ